MTRLLDRLIGSGGIHAIIYPGSIASLEHAIDAPLVVADNVGKYCADHLTPKEAVSASMFPNAAPPFPSFWIETNLRVLIEGGSVDLVYRVLSHVYATENYERDEAKWQLQIDTIAYRGGRLPYVLPTVLVDVSEVGEVLTHGDHDDGWASFLKSRHDHNGSFTSEEIETIEGHAQLCAIPVLMTISFMNCRNVTREIVTPNPKVSKKFEKHHGRPLTRYQTLCIEPMRETLRSEGREGDVGGRQALHICRGHFRTYDEKPLFGRLRGTFFVPAHARGSADRGVVKSDYEIGEVA